MRRGDEIMAETGIVAAMVGVRQPFQIQRWPVPEPEPGAVLVKVRLANICGSDLHLWKGHYIPADPGTPKLRSVGHEMCGSVAKLGEGVTHDSAGQPLKEGDRVVYCYFVPCRHCRVCLKQQTPHCPHGMRFRLPPDRWPHFNAAYGQYYYLRPGQALFKIPDNVSDDLAAPANCALAQVIDGLEEANAGFGDSVVIQGAGGLGVAAAAVARERGVRQTIVIDRVDDRLQMALAFGADHVIDMKIFTTPEQRIAQVKKLTDGWGADVVLEVTGRAEAVPEGIEMLGGGGVYAEIGCICEKEMCTIDPSALVLGGKKVLGLMWYKTESLLKAMHFLAAHQGTYPFNQLIAKRYPLTAINEAMAAQDAGKVHRSSLDPWLAG